MLEYRALRIEFAPADLAGLRFAHSPMVELVTRVFALDRPADFWMYDSWRAGVRPLLARAGVRTLRALIAAPTGYVPDFLTPVPATARPTLEEELRVVAATAPDSVAADGYGRIWDRPERVEPGAPLAALLGPTRAAVLTLLAVPRSTGEVASAPRLAPATASHHLTTLRDAGLVVGERVGRRLRYLRTALGAQLGEGPAANGPR